MEIVFDKISYFDQIIDIKLKIEKGKILGIIGQANSGKSAILELLKSYLKTQNIKVALVNQDIIDQFFFDTVKEELLYKTNMEKTNEKKIIDSLKITGLDKSILERSIMSLSSSELKRLALSIELIGNPDILLLDDIFNDLDLKDTEKIIKLIRMLKLKYNKTIIFTSKNSDIIHKISDKVILINDGKTIISGNKYDVFTKYKTIKENKIMLPKVIEFAKLAEEKINKKIEKRDDINDLVKDIYRYLR